MSKFKKILPLFLVLAMLIVAIFYYFEEKSSDMSTIKFKYTTLDGYKINLSDYNGRPVLLSFFATWCGPCREETPELVHLQKVYAGRGLQILGLSLDIKLDEDKVRKFMSDYKINYPVGFISRKDINQFGGITSIPTVIVIDRKGQISRTIVGYQGAKVLVDAIEQVI